MKKLYLANISIDKDIIVAAENDVKATIDTQNIYARDFLSNIANTDMFITTKEIVKKKDIEDELDNMPYGEDNKSIGQIWKEIQKYNKEKAHKEWLEKYHMTFDFYKETQDGR